MERRKHHLKTWPEPFAAVIDEDLDKRKTVELRKNDRDFQVGDLLVLEEWDPDTGAYTGRKTHRVITHIVKGGRFGLADDYVALSIKDNTEILAILRDHKFYYSWEVKNSVINKKSKEDMRGIAADLRRMATAVREGWDEANKKPHGKKGA